MQFGLTMRQRQLKNRSLSVNEYCAREAAKMARLAAQELLTRCYKKGFQEAEKKCAQKQIEENLEMVASIPGWVEAKGKRNGYVMVCTSIDETPRPIILELDYQLKPSGGLSYEMLFDQIRTALGLVPEASLRMCPWRPWYRYSQEPGQIPQRVALEARSKADATSLLGTILCFYSYVRLTPEDEKSD